MSDQQESEERVRISVQLPKRLREDAKRNAERGEISERVRDELRELAYGIGAREDTTELEKTKAELEEVRKRIDDLRRERSEIETEIQTHEQRATRLEEKIRRLEEEQEKMGGALKTLENMLQSGERMWPTRIKNAADVDGDTAEKLYQQLKDRNPELPEAAFKEPGVHAPTDWREETSA